MALYVGQKVARWGGNNVDNMPVPAIGETVTISALFNTPWGQGLQVLEYPIPARPGFSEGMFARWFRPVNERKTDISIFTKILDDARTKIPA